MNNSKLRWNYEHAVCSCGVVHTHVCGSVETIKCACGLHYHSCSQSNIPINWWEQTIDSHWRLLSDLNWKPVTGSYSTDDLRTAEFITELEALINKHRACIRVDMDWNDDLSIGARLCDAHGWKDVSLTIDLDGTIWINGEEYL